MDVLSFRDALADHHLGTLRCRREGASTPSNVKFAPLAQPIHNVGEADTISMLTWAE
jgi:hypothetical protein